MEYVTHRAPSMPMAKSASMGHDEGVSGAGFSKYKAILAQCRIAGSDYIKPA